MIWKGLNIMKFIKVFETTEIKEDDLGLHCICEECGASFDVDVDEIVEGK